MSREKISVTMTEETASLVRQRASAEGMTVSAWIDRAAYREAMRAAYEDHAVMLREAGQSPEELSAKFQGRTARRGAWKHSHGSTS